jgi:hypothetical protein
MKSTRTQLKFKKDPAKIYTEEDNQELENFLDGKQLATADDMPLITEADLNGEAPSYQAAHTAINVADIAEDDLSADEHAEATKECYALITQINTVRENQVNALTFVMNGAIDQATRMLLSEAHQLLKKPFANPAQELAALKLSLQLTLPVIEDPKNAAAVSALKLCADTIAPGKPANWKKVIAGIIFVCSAAAAIAAVVCAPIFAAPVIAFGIFGALAPAVGGAALYNEGTHHGVAEGMNNLVKAARI